MRSHLHHRLRSSSLSAVPPPQNSADYSPNLAKAAASILYKSPIPSQSGLPIYILNAAALPDAHEVDFDGLLPYVLARLPGEEELLTGTEYEVIFFAGGNLDAATATKKNRPGWGWFIQAYHVLSRAMRKRLQKLYIVHERSWVRILVEMFSTIVSPKFRRKIVHVSTLTSLALHIPIEDILIPPSAYLHDRRLTPDIHSPYNHGRRAFSVKEPLPKNQDGSRRLPRVLRETTSFILLEPNVRTEGLFRIPPHSRLKEILQEAYARGQKFIVWKDNGLTLPLPNYDRADGVDHIIDEIDQKDAYSIHLAAGLLKSWYTNLRIPIFPTTTYQDLRRDFSDPHHEFALDELTELISPHSEWPKLPEMSREILTRHLLPLLSKIVAHQEENKMTAENLAVCFAPALLCGPDQIEDAKMSSIIRRILAAAVESWPTGLREACKVDASAFERDLRAPKNLQDYEDPLEGFRDASTQAQSAADEKHFTGFVLEDNDPQMQDPPPLPPRPAISSTTAQRGPSGDAATRRKPAPPIATTPRYSTVVADGPVDMADSPISYYATTDGFAPPRSSEKAQEGTKSGTEAIGSAPQIVLPKRIALTAEQISQGKDKLVSMEHRSKPIGSDAQTTGERKSASVDIPKRKPVQSSSAVTKKASDDQGASDSASNTTYAEASVKSIREGSEGSAELLGGPSQFRKPSWPASARKFSLPGSDLGVLSSSPGSSFKSPTINSLARPVHVSAPIAQQPRKSATLPAPVAPKPRTPSPGLLKRMPSFEPSLDSSTSPKDGTSPRLVPKKLNLKQSSVDELRRLYEERAGTARTLVEAGLSSDSPRAGDQVFQAAFQDSPTVQ